jgi:hypothetical protein
MVRVSFDILVWKGSEVMLIERVWHNRCHCLSSLYTSWYQLLRTSRYITAKISSDQLTVRATEDYLDLEGCKAHMSLHITSNEPDISSANWVTQLLLSVVTMYQSSQ